MIVLEQANYVSAKRQRPASVVYPVITNGRSCSSLESASEFPGGLRKMFLI